MPAKQAAQAPAGAQARARPQQLSPSQQPQPQRQRPARVQCPARVPRPARGRCPARALQASAVRMASRGPGATEPRDPAPSAPVQPAVQATGPQATGPQASGPRVSGIPGPAASGSVWLTASGRPAPSGQAEPKRLAASRRGLRRRSRGRLGPHRWPGRLPAPAEAPQREAGRPWPRVPPCSQWQRLPPRDERPTGWSWVSEGHLDQPAWAPGLGRVQPPQR